MLTLNDIINVSFRKSNFSGYKTEDVDAFIDQVKDSYDALIKKTIEQKESNEALATENGQLTKKIEVLAGKIENYRSEEDEIKTALISAQKLGDASVREARHKAEIIVKDASQKAERIVSTAKNEAIQEQKTLEQLKKEVSDFRTKLLGIYKEHLTMIDAIPSQKDAPKREELPVRQPVPEPEPEPVAQAEPFAPVEDFYMPPATYVPPVEPQHFAPDPVAEPLFAEPLAEQTLIANDFDDFADPASLEATREFVVDASAFETRDSDPSGKDLRYDVLKFGDDYDISEDNL